MYLGLFRSHELSRFPKIANFNSQRLAFHQNGVEFRQKFNGAIRMCRNITKNLVRTYIHTYIHTYMDIHRDKATHRARLPRLPSLKSFLCQKVFLNNTVVYPMYAA